MWKGLEKGRRVGEEEIKMTHEEMLFGLQAEKNFIYACQVTQFV